MNERQLRHTAKGEAILGALRDCGTFRSAQDVHAVLRSGGDRVGLTTVYRHLQALAAQGVVDSVQMTTGQTAYRYCDRSEHHHHLVCRECGRTAELDCPDVERWTQEVAGELGYAELTHVLEVYGTCAACRRRA